jgi:antitoxin CptB
MPDTTSDDTQTRQRRALFRATHRGTKEMDWMLGRYATAKLPTMVGDELTRFEALIQRADPELQRWLMDAALTPAPEVAEQIAAIRAFHDAPSAVSQAIAKKSNQ